MDVKKHNIIYCIDFFCDISGAGATDALKMLITDNQYLGAYKVFCKRYLCGDNVGTIIPLESTGKDVVDEFINGEYKCIHWLRADGCQLYIEIIKELKLRKISIPIVSTICQQPSFPQYFLSPWEVKYPSLIIFIDNTAYHDKFFNFLPENRRRMLRFGGISKEGVTMIENVVKGTKRSDKKGIVYGRGSSLNKCPQNMFDVFDKINPPKKFVIVGNGNKDWIQQEISKRSDYEVKLLDAMPYRKWLETLATFDIFLYHLPMDTYSSTDGTLINALLMGKAVVYYGPDAPTEVLIDNYNSRVAHSTQQLVDICNELAANEKDRKRLGENAKTIYKEFQTKEQFFNSMNDLYSSIQVLPANKLSFLYIIAYIKNRKQQYGRWPIHDEQLFVSAMLYKIRCFLGIRTRIRKLFKNIC